jgi:hypothetical protein
MGNHDAVVLACIFTNTLQTVVRRLLLSLQRVRRYFYHALQLRLMPFQL